MGKVVGGTSSVNAMMGFRGHPANFEAWEKAGHRGWSSDALAPYFERAFGLGLEAPCSSRGGILSLSRQRFHSPFSEAFLAACEQDGMTREAPLLGLVDGCCGYFPVLQRNGGRLEAAKGYLLPVRNHRRLTLQTGTHVRRVLLEKERAIGIETVRNGKAEVFRATAGVIVCSGVFETPRLLQCSGIGPDEVLRAAGIPVHLDLRGVGANFHDHVRVGMLYQTGRVSPGSKRHWIPGFLRYLLRRDGVMASNCCESGAFFCSKSSRNFPDIELITHFQTFGPKGEVDIEVCLVDPKSRGRVFVNPQAPFGLPLVDANFLADEADVSALESAIRRVQSIAERPALREFPLLEPTSPAAKAHDESTRRAAIFGTATTAYHPCGSCAMGPEGQGVLGADLRVRGMENLWVADASAMPSAPSGNIACAVVVLAEKASDLILSRVAQHSRELPDS
jgi:choline dehydrogenase-like flavoprotein